MHFLDLKKNNILPFYNKIVFLTRKNLFYINFALSDSLSNRIYLIFFHLSFILILLKKRKYSKKKSQEIFDFFFLQIELNCREIGYGDTNINKKMKALIKSFYEILMKCDKWKQIKNDKKKRILIKFFSTNSNSKKLPTKLSKYFDKCSTM